jgi:cell division protein FtsL
METMKSTTSETIIRRPISGQQGAAFRRAFLYPSFLFIFLVFVISVFFVWSRVELVHLEYDISSMEGKLRTLKQEQRCLRLEVASLRSPSRIEQVARNDLGMHMPNPEQILVVK